MKQGRTLVLMLLLCSAAWAQAGGAAATTAAEIRPASSPEQLESRYPALREIKMPEVETHRLSNGITVYLLEDHSLPIVTGSALIRTGNLFDPAGKVGLAQLTGTVWRIGGTKSRSGEDLDQELENMAASVETGIGETSGAANFWTLKENLDRVLEIYADVLTNPAFRQEKIDFAKQQMRSEIARRNDDPGQIADREFRNLVYGKDSPYGWQIEYEHLDNIERSDLVSFYERYVFPANLTLAVYGDFASEEMKARLERVFKAWAVQQPAAPPFPEVDSGAAPAVFLAAKGDVNQTNVRMGHLGGVLKDKDYPALAVMGTILGGGFQSRLFRKVRSELGLAYAAGGNWGADYGHPGVFNVYLATKSESSVAATKAVLGEIERLRSDPVSDQELKTAKDSVLNSFVFNFDTPSKVLRRLQLYRYWGYPDDFIFQYRQGIRDVTQQDILRVAKTRLKPEQLTMVVVGNPEQFDQPLTALGKPLKELDISIPVPKKAAAQQDASSLSRGREILVKAQKAAGGAEKLAEIKDVTKVSTMQAAAGMNAQQTVKIVLPDVMRQENELPFGKIAVFVSGKGGWIQGPQGQMPLPEPHSEQAQGELFRLLESLLLSDRVAGRTINFIKEADLEGRKTEVIEISAEGREPVRLWIDAESGDVLKSAYREVGIQGAPSDVERFYADYRDVNGIRVPFKSTVFQNGTQFAEAVISEVRYNSGLTKEELAKP